MAIPPLIPLVMYDSLSTCELCGQQFPSSGALTAARSKVYLAKACTLCTITMVQDFLEQRTTSPESQCDDCNASFKSRKGLMQHIGKIHTAERKAAACPECNKKFKHKYAVRFHVKQVHNKATRVSCDDCGREFYNKYLLKSHSEEEH